MTRFFNFLTRHNDKTIVNELTTTSNGSSPLTNIKNTNKKISNNSNNINKELEQEIITNGRRHVKLNGCEDLKESIEHYNQRCAAVQQMKQTEKLQQQFNKNNINYNDTTSTKSQIIKNPFLSFKKFTKYKNIKTDSTNNKSMVNKIYLKII